MNDIVVRFAMLWGETIGSALTPEEIKKAEDMKQYDSEELFNLLSGWAEEYLNGDYDDTVIQVANELGYHVIQWDVDSLDWKDYGADSIIHTVTCHKHLGNGSIILMHNGAKYTKDALEEMIINLKEQGYEFVKVSDLIYKENYKMDHEGRQYVEGLFCPPQANVTPTPIGELKEY